MKPEISVDDLYGQIIEHDQSFAIAHAYAYEARGEEDSEERSVKIKAVAKYLKEQEFQANQDWPVLKHLAGVENLEDYLDEDTFKHIDSLREQNSDLFNNEPRYV